MRAQGGEGSDHGVSGCGDQTGEVGLGERDVDLDAVGVWLAVLVGELEKEERQPLGDVEGSGVDPSAVGGAEPVDDPAQEVWGDSRMRVEESPEFFAGDDAAFDRFECGVAGGAGASVVVDRFEDAEQVTGTVDGQHGLAAVEVGRTATPGDKRGVSWTGMAGWLED